MIKMYASKADKALIVAHMAQQLDLAAAKAHGRKIAALKLLGF
jgi:hypothetical protein